jgi:hypothetical protein
MRGDEDAAAAATDHRDPRAGGGDLHDAVKRTLIIDNS